MRPPISSAHGNNWHAAYQTSFSHVPDISTHTLPPQSLTSVDSRPLIPSINPPQLHHQQMFYQTAPASHYYNHNLQDSQTTSSASKIYTGTPITAPGTVSSSLPYQPVPHRTAIAASQRVPRLMAFRNSKVRKAEISPSDPLISVPRRRRSKEHAWKDRFDDRIIHIAQVIAKHTNKSIPSSYRLLNKYVTYDMASDLLSGDEAREKKAMTNIHPPEGKKGLRLELLGSQAVAITKRYQDHWGLNWKQAKDKLNSSLTPTIAELLKNPETFKIGAAMMKCVGRPREKKGNSAMREEKGKATMKGKGNAMKAIVPKSKAVESSTPGFDTLQGVPRSAQIHSPTQQQIHLESSSDHASTSSAPLHHAPEADSIDFDAVVEWVHRSRQQAALSGVHT